MSGRTRVAGLAAAGKNRTFIRAMRHPMSAGFTIPPAQPYHLLFARGMIVFLAKQVKTNSVLDPFSIPIR